MSTTAQIIDQHRPAARWVGDGVTVECICGHGSKSSYDFTVPFTEERNNHRDADRKHAQHVADLLAAQEVTDAEVEAAAIMLCASAHHGRVWEALAKVDPVKRDRLRVDARAALTAAQDARP